MRLFHFSDDPAIETFVPRPVRVPAARPPGMGWLNGPLVWAIDDWHQPMYFFPRDCPRVLLWKTPQTVEADARRWWDASTARIIAFVEWAWFDRLKTGTLHRYELPEAGFEYSEAGMWVSRAPVTPLAVDAMDDLPAAMARSGVELRVVESLTRLKGVWETTVHFSGIRLRNAQGWKD
jgi:hypothetical protein